MSTRSLPLARRVSMSKCERSTRTWNSELSLAKRHKANIRYQTQTQLQQPSVKHQAVYNIQLPSCPHDTTWTCTSLPSSLTTALPMKEPRAMLSPRPRKSRYLIKWTRSIDPHLSKVSTLLLQHNLQANKCPDSSCNHLWTPGHHQ